MADILVNVGFKVGSANPLDSKAKVRTIAERDALISEGLAYESLRTYVTSKQKWYEYDGSTWNEVTESGITPSTPDITQVVVIAVETFDATLDNYQYLLTDYTIHKVIDGVDTDVSDDTSLLIRWIEISQEQYEALPDTEKEKDYVWYVY